MVLLNLFASYGPWAWFVTGLILLALELVVPGGYFLWLGAAGLVTGLAAFIPGLGWPLQVTIFGGLGLVAVIAWTMVTRHRKPQSEEPLLNQRTARFIGHEGVIDEPIRDGYGRMALGDTIWRISGPDVAAGARVRVIGADGAVLKVEPV